MGDDASILAARASGGTLTRMALGSGVDRREEIFAAAARIFSEKGYHATSMRDLAEAMSMRKASLYHHLDRKETLLYEMSVSSMHHMIEAATHATSLDPEERLRQLILHHVVALLEDRSRHATALVELRSMEPPHRKHVIDLRDQYDAIVDDVLLAVHSATGRWPGIPMQRVRLALLGMLNWTVFWYSPEEAESAESIAGSFSAIFLPPRA
jgi:AcrR family transcriptional regulator